MKKEESIKQLTFMEMKPFEMNEQSSFGGTSSETQFVGRNPSTNARITYLLSKRHTFGKMTMEVQDMDGNFLSKLSPGKKKGINIVDWAFRSSVPKIAKGKTFSVGGMTAPRVAAGKYKVVIQKGKEKFETTIDVAYPKNSIFSLSERDEQFKTSKMLYDLNEELAYIVYQIDEISKHTLESAKNPKLKKTALKLNSELISLKETLVVTKGDNYVGTVEDQLREKLANIYGEITGYYGAPTDTQMENVDLIVSEMNGAIVGFDKVQSGSIKKYNLLLSKNELPKIQLKSKVEFLKK